MLQSCFNNKVRTLYTHVLIQDKNTHELKNNVNPKGKKLNFSRFFTFYVPTKDLGKVGEKQSFMRWKALSLVKIPTPQVRYLYLTWTLMVYCLKNGSALIIHSFEVSRDEIQITSRQLE